MEIIKRLRWQLMILILALAVIAVLLWGQRAEEPRVLESPEPAGGGVYTEGVVGSLKRLNPLLATFNPVDRAPTSLLFRGLIQFDSKGLPQPDIANSWGISRDGQVYNFSLREDVTWHDGQPLTSEDVAFTIELMQQEGFPLRDDLREFWQQIEVEVGNETTLQIRLPEAYAPFLDYLNFGILPAHLLGDLSAEEIVDAEFNLQPVGNGPYQFERLLVEGGEIQGLSLRKNPDYYGGEPFLDQITFRYYQDHQSVWEAYQGEEVQGIGEITEGILEESLQAPGLNLYTSRMPMLSLVLFNLDNPEVPFFQEVEVRQALLEGLNRQWMVDRIFQGQAVVAQGPILPKTWAYFNGLEGYPYQPERAVERLQDVGYVIPAEGGDIREDEEGSRFQFTLVHPDQDQHRQVAEAIQKNWQALGVGVELKAVPYQELITEHLEARDYQAVLVDLNLTRSPDPDPYPFWHEAQTTGGQNYAGWSDRQASEYLEQARIELDISQRERLYKNFQVRFMDQLPALPLYYPMYTYGVTSELKGVRIGPIFEPADRLQTITEWYFYSEIPGGQEVGTQGPPGEQ